MSFEIIEGNILRQPADAIVLPTKAFQDNKIYLVSNLTEKIYKEAGYRDVVNAINEHIKRHGELSEGDVFSTPGFSLNFKHIIHVCVPRALEPNMRSHTIMGINNNYDPDRVCHVQKILRVCYIRALNLADKIRAESVAIPLLKSIYPILGEERTFQTASLAIQEWLRGNESSMKVYLYKPASWEPVVKTQAEPDAPLPDFGKGSVYFEYAERMSAEHKESGKPIDIFFSSIVTNAFYNVPSVTALGRALEYDKTFISRVKNGATTHKDRAIALAVVMNLKDGYERYKFIISASMEHEYPVDERDKQIELLFGKGITDFRLFNEELAKINPSYPLNLRVKSEKTIAKNKESKTRE